MWGNHMADRAASEDLDCFESWGPGVEVINITMTEILEEMEQTDMWMMKELSLSLAQTTIKLDNLKSSILDARARKYRENRDNK